MSRGRTILAWLAAGAIGTGAALAVRTAAAAEDGLNACGCRQGSSGACYCEKKSRCGCPGECEPKGCEEKRSKQLEKEVQEETRKAEESSRRQRARQETEQENEQRNENENDRQQREPRSRVGEDRSAERTPTPPPKVRVVKMTPAQKRDLARLIKVYLAEHPDQGGKAIGQVENEVSGR